MSAPIPQDYQPSPSEAQLQRALKIAIAIMTMLIIAGLGAIAYRILASPRFEVPHAGLGSAATIELPQGAEVRNLALSGNVLAVHFAGPSGAGVALVDTASGKRISTFGIASSGEKAN